MKRLYFILVFLLILNCKNKEKRYEDYNEEDFIEVQGILTKTNGRSTFQNHVVTDIFFIYNLNLEKPNTGYELKSPYIIEEGEPVIILVHKDDSNISFFGARGIIEEEILLNYLEKCEQIGGGYYGVDTGSSEFNSERANIISATPSSARQRPDKSMEGRFLNFGSVNPKFVPNGASIISAKNANDYSKLSRRFNKFKN